CFPAFRLLPPVEGRVDLDRAELARGIFELFGLRQLVRIKAAPPRRIGPAANADADATVAHSRINAGFGYLAAAAAGPGTLQSSTALNPPSACFLSTVRYVPLI